MLRADEKSALVRLFDNLVSAAHPHFGATFGVEKNAVILVTWRSGHDTETTRRMSLDDACHMRLFEVQELIREMIEEVR